MADKTQNSQAVMTVSAKCSPGLWTRLTETNNGKGWFQRVDELKSDPRAVAEIRANFSAIAASRQPADPKFIVRELARMAPIYGIADRSPAEWSTFWRFYIDALEDVPPAALVAAIKEYVSAPDSNFFPRPGPLKAICDKHAAPVRVAHRLSEVVLKEAPKLITAGSAMENEAVA